MIEFNPEDFIIEEAQGEADGPVDINVTLEPPAISQVGSMRPKSSVSRPKSAVNVQSRKGDKRFAAKRVKKIVSKVVQDGE